MANDQATRRVRVKRKFPFHGTTYEIGTVRDFPAATARKMVKASPPFGEYVDGDEEEAPAPKRAYDFTSAASQELAEAGIPEADYRGDATLGNGQRVSKGDVMAWLATLED